MKRSTYNPSTLYSYNFYRFSVLFHALSFLILQKLVKEAVGNFCSMNWHQLPRSAGAPGRKSWTAEAEIGWVDHKVILMETKHCDALFATHPFYMVYADSFI